MKFKFSYEALNEIKLEDVYYTIERAEGLCFYGKCPICDDSGKIIIRDTAFTCPKCNGYKGSNSPVLSVNRYTVQRWRICGISYAFEKRVPCRLGILLGSTSGRSSYSNTFELKGRDLIDFKSYSHGQLYRDYSEAKKIADSKNLEEVQKVLDYNRQYNTAYEFKQPEYDKKSN